MKSINSKIQVTGTKLKIVEVRNRMGNHPSHCPPSYERVSYRRLEEFAKSFEGCSRWITPLSNEFVDKHRFAGWSNLCTASQVHLHDVFHNSARISLNTRNGLRPDASRVVAALWKGKTIVFVRSIHGNDKSYRLFTDYREYKLIDGFEVEGKIYPF